MWVRVLVSAFFKYCAPWNLVDTFNGRVCRWPHAGEDARGGKVRSIKRELSPPAPLPPPATPRQMGLHSSSNVALSYASTSARGNIGNSDYFGFVLHWPVDLYCNWPGDPELWMKSSKLMSSIKEPPCSLAAPASPTPSTQHHRARAVIWKSGNIWRCWGVYCGYNVIDNGFTGRGGKKEITSGR